MICISRKLRERLAGDEGLSIVEVMVAMVVFAIIAVGIAGGITSSLVLSGVSKSRVAATNLAQQAIDTARTTKDVFSLRNATNAPVSVGGVAYTVSRTANWISATGEDVTCGAGTGALAYKRVTVKVAWTDGKRAAQSVSMDTLVAPTSTVSDEDNGTVVVVVSNALGIGNPGVTVTVTPGTTPNGATTLSAQPGVTDSDGCAYATNVTPGNYTVKVVSSDGRDPVQATSTTKSLTVVQGQTASQTFTYDTAATYNLQFPSDTTNPITLPRSLSAVLRHTGTPDVSMGTATSMKAFPFKEGYWAVPGTYSATCTNGDPGAWSTPNGTAVSAPQIPVQVLAGASQPAVPVPMGVFAVKLSSALDNAVVATTVTAGGNGDPGCATTTTYVFAGLSNTARLALPYGTYTLTEGIGIGSAVTLTLGATPTVTATTGVVPSGNRVMLDPRRVPSS